jgi:hypothetical protein
MKTTHVTFSKKYFVCHSESCIRIEWDQPQVYPPPPFIHLNLTEKEIALNLVSLPYDL